MLLVAAGSQIAPATWSSLNGPHIDVPGTRSLDLDDGTNVLFERTGNQVSGGVGPVTGSFTQVGSASFGPEDVAVTAPDGSLVPIRWAGNVQTIQTGDDIYIGVVEFEVTQDGEYSIEISAGGPSDVIVSKDIGESLSDLIGWFALGVAGVILMGIATVAMIVRAARDARARPSRSDLPPPPAT